MSQESSGGPDLCLNPGEGGLGLPPRCSGPWPQPLAVFSHSCFYPINVPHFLRILFLQLVPQAPLFKPRGRKSVLDR